MIERRKKVEPRQGGREVLKPASGQGKPQPKQEKDDARGA